ncbi:MAG: Hsp70 family protein [Planctomycetaceae bacterium]|nr:Hsp70 family protein [Planctomycetaceae bacterium]
MTDHDRNYDELEIDAISDESVADAIPRPDNSPPRSEYAEPADSTLPSCAFIDSDELCEPLVAEALDADAVARGEPDPFRIFAMSGRATNSNMNAAEPGSIRIASPTHIDATAVRIAGIDLGTTYSAVSWYSAVHRRVETLSMNHIGDGQLVAPSVVYYPQGGEPVVGTAAENIRNVEYERVIVGVKRSMGKTWTQIIDERTLTPESVSAEILKAVFAEAKRFLGDSETRVVITVPARFGDAAANATRKAGELAGLEVLSLLSEPHAAALAFTVERVSGQVESGIVDIVNRNILVFDLGGGTLDVALIRIEVADAHDGGQLMTMRTIFKDGEEYLGGLNWDEKLEEVVLKKYRTQIGDEEYTKFAANPSSRPMLRREIERAKRNLSQINEVKVPILFNTVVVTREEFNVATVGLLRRCEIKLDAVLRRAEVELQIKRKDVPIVMAGGGTRMPQVIEMIADVAGSKPLETSNPELLVTNGAAYWGHMLAAGGSIQTGGGAGLTITAEGIREIVHYAVGIRTLEMDDGGQYSIATFTEIIPRESVRGPADEVLEQRLEEFIVNALDSYARNQELPGGDGSGGVYSKVFFKSEDKMMRIPIQIFSREDDSQTLEQAQKMGEVAIMDLPADGRRGEPVLVALAHDADGILRGRSADITTGRQASIVIRRNADRA